MPRNYGYRDGFRSERLITQFLTLNDVEAWAEFFEDPESLKFIPFYAFNSTIEKANFLIEKQLGRYADKQYGLQAVCDKQSGELLGICGLLLQEVAGVNEVEIGYHFLRKHWHKGYATEAAAVFKKYAFTELELPSVVSIIDISNTRSQYVALRNGMNREKQLRWRDFDVYIYRVVNPL